MELFYTGKQNIAGDDLLVEGEEFHHLRHVLRLGESDEAHVADGEGTMYRVRIERILRDGAHCRIEEWMPGFNEPRRKVTLAQALLKQPARMEWIVEKATELGVARILPLAAERCLSRHPKPERWAHLARSAMKQCLRCTAPEILPLASFADAIRMSGGSGAFLFHESATAPLADASLPPEEESLVIFIGPEGGFSEREVDEVRAAGGKILSLGARRLRSETAAVASLSRILAR